MKCFQRLVSHLREAELKAAAEAARHGRKKLGRRGVKTSSQCQAQKSRRDIA